MLGQCTTSGRCRSWQLPVHIGTVSEGLPLANGNCSAWKYPHPPSREQSRAKASFKGRYDYPALLSLKQDHFFGAIPRAELQWEQAEARLLLNLHVFLASSPALSCSPHSPTGFS